MIAAIKAFLAGNPWLIAVLVALIFGAGFGAGYKVRHTIELADKALQQDAAEKARLKMAEELQTAVKNLGEAQSKLKTKQAIINKKVRDELAKNAEGFKCPIPDSAIELLNSP